MDLGLPSGTKWATQNVGARKPSDYGLYFAWGDNSGYTADQVGTGEGQKKFAEDWSDYKWGVRPNFTKYTTKGATLELEDDAAHVYMGGDWHMPSRSQCQELFGNTTTAWTTSDGIKGITLTSKKDTSKSIFIPTAGYALSGSVKKRGAEAAVWSSLSEMEGDVVTSGVFLNLEENFLTKPGLEYLYRSRGISVRGVIG